jgi:hypothetical protein
MSSRIVPRISSARRHTKSGCGNKFNSLARRSTRRLSRLASVFPRAMGATLTSLRWWRGQQQQQRSNVPTSGAGRLYWAETAMELGLVDTDLGICFENALPPNVSVTVPSHENGTTRASQKRAAMLICPSTPSTGQVACKRMHQCPKSTTLLLVQALH